MGFARADDSRRARSGWASALECALEGSIAAAYTYSAGARVRPELPVE